MKPSELKMAKKEPLDIDEHVLLRLLTKVLISKRSPNVEIKEFFKVRRPSKVDREALVDIVFFVLHHKKRLFFSALESNYQRNFSTVISGVLRLAMAVWISSDNLPLNMRNRGNLAAFKRFKLFENGFFPDYSKVSIRFSCPVWIVKNLAEKKGPDNAFRALCSSKRSNYICLRVNTGKSKVGEISKNFIDCGGTVRSEKTVNFQLWSADDYNHRLETDKILKIIELAEKQLGLKNLEIEVEYQSDTIAKYGLEFDGQRFLLTSQNTDCLAKDKCGITENPSVKISSDESTSYCSPESGCC